MVNLTFKSSGTNEDRASFSDGAAINGAPSLFVKTDVGVGASGGYQVSYVPISVEDAQTLAQAILTRWPLADGGDNKVITEGEEGEPLARGAINRELPEVFEEMIHEFSALEDAIINAVTAHRDTHELRMSRILGNARKLGAKARVLARKHRAIKEQFDLLKAQQPVPDDQVLVQDKEAW